MKLEKTLEKLKSMDERLIRLQRTQEEFSITLTGYIHTNMRGQAHRVDGYLGSEVSKEELLEAGSEVVEELVEADKIFRDLRDVKNAFSELDNEAMINGRMAEEWIYEITDYMEERRQIAENIFELSEPINESDEVDFDMRSEYYERVKEFDYLMFEEA